MHARVTPRHCLARAHHLHARDCFAQRLAKGPHLMQRGLDAVRTSARPKRLRAGGSSFKPLALDTKSPRWHARMQARSALKPDHSREVVAMAGVLQPACRMRIHSHTSGGRRLILQRLVAGEIPGRAI